MTNEKRRKTRRGTDADGRPRCKCGHTSRSHRCEDDGWGGGRFCKVALCGCPNYEPREASGV